MSIPFKSTQKEQLDMEDAELLMDESLYDEVNRKDSNVVLLVELLHLLSSSLRSDPAIAISEPASSEEIETGLIGRPFQNLTITLKKLAAIPGSDRYVLIRARVPDGETFNSVHSGYEVGFSDITLDRLILTGMIQRIGERMGYLGGLMDRAFDVFADFQISCLCIRLPNDAPGAYDDLKASLQILSRYHKALETNTPICIPGEETERCFPVVYDESGRPDVNLTLLSGLNDISPQKMENLVQQVGNWMKSSDVSAGAHRYANVYNAIIGTRGLDEKLKQPPIEINNIKWLLMERGKKKLSKSKAQLARILQNMPDASPMHQIRYVQCLYGMDYPKVEPLGLLNRLERVAELVATVGDRPKRDLVMEEILTHLQWRLDKVADAVFDDIDIKANSLRLDAENDGETVVVELKSRAIARMFAFFKKRARTRRKMRNIGDHELCFDSENFEIIAREFDISPVDARDILGVIKRCFDTAGHFVKGEFENSLEELSRFESKAFEILWHYLKEPLTREDRLAFLNAVQLFFVRLKQPDKALEILLEDFISETRLVRYSDRNAVMLATLLLRKYNKELDIDIEITPEEVFLVRDGLNRVAAATALYYLDTHKEKLFEKIRTIHRKIFETMDPATVESVGMTTKYLLSLEREIHIFLALSGGDIARSVLRGALNSYGNPDNELYRLAASDRLRQALVQHLKVLVRGLGRAGDMSDMPALEQILKQKADFLKISSEPRYAMLIERTMEYADRAVQDMDSQRRLVVSA